MPRRVYDCDIIGDGLTPETAYRPALFDIIDPNTGSSAFPFSTGTRIPTDARTGIPTVASIEYVFEDLPDRVHNLTRNNQRIRLR